jgi:hypothetical protein
MQAFLASAAVFDLVGKQGFKEAILQALRALQSAEAAAALVQMFNSSAANFHLVSFVAWLFEQARSASDSFPTIAVVLDELLPLLVDRVVRAFGGRSLHVWLLAWEPELPALFRLLRSTDRPSLFVPLLRCETLRRSAAHAVHLLRALPPPPNAQLPEADEMKSALAKAVSARSYQLLGYGWPPVRALLELLIDEPRQPLRDRWLRFLLPAVLRRPTPTEPDPLLRAICRWCSGT